MWDTTKGPLQIQVAECEGPDHQPLCFSGTILHTLHNFLPKAPSSGSHSVSIISYIFLPISMAFCYDIPPHPPKPRPHSVPLAHGNHTLLPISLGRAFPFPLQPLKTKPTPICLIESLMAPSQSNLFLLCIAKYE